MSEIIIGVDGTECGEDAAAFGRRIAAFAGARVVLAHAFPYDDIAAARRASPTARRCARSRGQSWSRGATAMGSIAGTSPARTARARRARRRRAGRRRFLARRPGASAAAGQHRRAPPVRLAVRGRRGARWLSKTEREAPRRIGVGIDGGPESTEALRRAGAWLARWVPSSK
jgi:hypothetical protein